MTLWEHFARSVVRHHDAPALEIEGAVYTYGELDRCVRALANPARRRAQVGWNVLWTGVSGLATLWIALIVLVLLSTIVLGGWRTITWEFLSQNPAQGLTKGGIFPAIFGTVAWIRRP